MTDTAAVPVNSAGDLWARFVAQLSTRGRRFEDVAQATDRAAVLRACGLDDALDMATLETEWASRMKAGDSATDSLKTYFATAEQRTLEPWRVEDQRLQAERNAVKAMTLGEVQDAFLEAAKNATLTPDEVMTGTYLLFANTDAAKQYGMMVLQRRGLARVRAHNSFVLEHMEASLSSANASRIAALQFPLFPPTKAFNGPNARLMIEAESEVAGGRKRAATTPAVFRRADVDGGGVMPVVQDPQTGMWGVDMTEVEKAFDGLFAIVRQLGADVQTLQEKDVKEKMQGHIEAMKNQLTTTIRGVRNTTGTGRGNAYRGGRGRGGGGRGRGF